MAKFVTVGITGYQTIVEGMIERDPGIDKYFGFVVIKTPFVKAQMPLSRLSGDRA